MKKPNHLIGELLITGPFAAKLFLQRRGKMWKRVHVRLCPISLNFDQFLPSFLPTETLPAAPGQTAACSSALEGTGQPKWICNADFPTKKDLEAAKSSVLAMLFDGAIILPHPALVYPYLTTPRIIIKTHILKAQSTNGLLTTDMCSFTSRTILSMKARCSWYMQRYMQRERYMSSPAHQRKDSIQPTARCRERSLWLWWLGRFRSFRNRNQSESASAVPIQKVYSFR